MNNQATFNLSTLVNGHRKTVAANDNHNLRAEAYNREAEVVLRQVMSGGKPAPTPKVRMSDVMDYIHKHQPNPVVYEGANDN